jgi:flagellar hook-associated protein 1 FlgK
MGSGIYGIGLSGLAAAEASLLTAGHNIANVNTPGYSRQEVVLSNRTPVFSGGGFIGAGVDIRTVRRVYDDFLGAQLNRAQGNASQLETYSGELSKLDNLFGDPASGLSPALSDFFASINALAGHPADGASRQTVLSSANALVARFKQVDSQLTEIRTSENEQIQSGVATINSLASQIAGLNQKIAVLTGGTQQVPNDLLDQRDQLVSDLNKQIGANVIVQDDGSYNVFMSNGQALVVGTNASTLVARPNPDDPRNLQIGLQTAGGVLGFASNQLTGGAVGGLLANRDGALDAAQDALGRIAVVLGQSFNDQHHLGLDLNGSLGGDFFTVPTPVVTNSTANTGNAVLNVSIASATALTGSDYRLAYDGANYTLTRLSDNTTQTFATLPQSVDGVTFALASGAPAAGDRFLIQPTHFAAGNLAVKITDPAAIAAAGPVVTGAGLANAGAASIGGVSVDSTYLASPLGSTITLTYASGTNTLSGFPAVPVSVTVGGTTTVYPAATPVPYTSGATISFSGMTFSITGTPANSDTFTLAPNTAGTGDNHNATALAALASANLVGGSTTFTGAYSQIVSAAGNAAQEASIEQDAQNAMLAQTQQAQQSVSGVNLDEEAANLEKFQQAYQASSKVMVIANTLFDSILEIARAS